MKFGRGGGVKREGKWGMWFQKEGRELRGERLLIDEWFQVDGRKGGGE